MRRLVVLVVCALVACGEKPEPRPAPTPAASWPDLVAYAAEGEGTGLDIFVRDAGGEPRQLTDGRRDEFSPSWAPGGMAIAYRVNPRRGDEGDIWVMDRDGEHKRNLTRSPGVADWSPAFSPDGRQIAFMSQHELWVMDLGGGDKRQLTHAGELSEYPSWKPSGRELVFSGVRGGNFEILRISARGGREQNLTNHPAPDKWPDWSPDGKLIAFERDEDVFVMRADGRDVRNISRTPEETETHPVWTPDGRLSFLQHGESGPVHVRVADPAGAYNLPIDAVFVYDLSAKGPA